MNGTGTPTTPLPQPTDVTPRSLTERESQLVKILRSLQFVRLLFLMSSRHLIRRIVSSYRSNKVDGFARWQRGRCRSLYSQQTIPSDYLQGNAFNSAPMPAPHPNLNRFLLPSGEHVACVFWNGLYHITGTDIGKYRCLVIPDITVNSNSSGFGVPLRSIFPTGQEYQKASHS